MVGFKGQCSGGVLEFCAFKKASKMSQVMHLY